MKLKTFNALFIWLISLIGVIEVGCEFVSSADTLLNILGIALMAGFGFASYITNCFTKINTK